MSQPRQHLRVPVSSFWIFIVAQSRNDDRMSGALVPRNKRAMSCQAPYQRIVEQSQRPAVGDRVQLDLSRKLRSKRPERV